MKIQIGGTILWETSILWQNEDTILWYSEDTILW